MNALFLWDLHLNKSLDRWKEDNRDAVGRWIDALGEFEALISLSVMDMITPVSAYPTFTFEGPEFHAADLSHPYIPFERRVTNNVDINGISIITGSNMSGKTTLLRTVGINLVLAYAGAPVCASSLRTGIMTVYTSMRNNDDLSEGVSTFYAELVRIKKIVDYSKKHENMIFLIDEIFKGTNSKDRIEGAKTALKGLDKSWTAGLISTHDYELCDLEYVGSKRFSNYYFSESYNANQIHFDYKLRRGRCTASNARYLMKMVGLE
jgi:DNA mismatch repair ATPase MutS